MLRYAAAQILKICAGHKFLLFILAMTLWGSSAGQYPCQVVGLHIRTQTDSSITLAWTFIVPDTIASHFESEYRETPAGPWKKAFFQYGDDIESCMILDPAPGKCYECRVRGICLSSYLPPDTTAWFTIVVNNGISICPASPPNPPTPPSPPSPPNPPSPPTPPAPPVPPSPPVPAPYVNPDFSFTVDPCFPSHVRFSNSTTASGTTVRSFEWNLGENTKSTARDPVHTYKKTGSYEVTLTVTDSSGKIHSKTVTVPIAALNLRFAVAGKDQVVCNKDTLILNASGGENYSWSPCSGLNNCRIPTPRVNPGTTMNYIVTVTNKDGCMDNDTVSVKYVDLKGRLFVPDVFTPNNDGINDQFRPLISLQPTIDAEWKIFNRFGNVIFASNKGMAGWDGTRNGELQPAGNYTYVIHIKAADGCPANSLKGTVLLVR